LAEYIAAKLKVASTSSEVLVINASVLSAIRATAIEIDIAVMMAIASL